MSGRMLPPEESQRVPRIQLETSHFQLTWRVPRPLCVVANVFSLTWMGSELEMRLIKWLPVRRISHICLTCPPTSWLNQVGISSPKSPAATKSLDVSKASG